MGLLRGAWRIFKKDLAHEFRSGQTLSILLVFSLAVLLVFRFSFDLSDGEAERFLAGFFWITVLLTSVLGFWKTMEIERRAGGLKGLLLAPNPRGAVFLGKAAGSFLFLLLVEIILVPIFVLFLADRLPPARVFSLFVPLLLGGAGLAALGTFLSCLCQVSRQSGILFALGYFPLAVPVLITGTRLSQGILRGDAMGGGPWMRFLAGIDVIYLVAGLLLFDYLVEE